MEILTQIAKALEDVRTRKPLVHHITNYVTPNDCANIVLCLGGSPVMASAAEEVADMVAVADCLVLNIGTLFPAQVDVMLKAGEKANVLGKPIILDPVGAGATPLRTHAARTLLDRLSIAVVRGNAAEIGILAGEGGQIKGVDSVGASGDMAAVARKLAQARNTVVAVTGKVDVVSDGRRVCEVANGHLLLTRVTGTGCMATSLIGTFAGVTRDYLVAAVGGLVAMGLAGEQAAAMLGENGGPGSFKVHLFDRIAALTPAALTGGAKVTCR